MKSESCHPLFSGLWNAFLFYGTLIYFLTSTCDGALRYFLLNHGLEKLLYVKDVFIITAIAGVVFKEFYKGRISPIFWGSLIVIPIWGMLCWMYVGNIIQALFGVKIFLPFIFGLVVASLMMERVKTTTYFLGLLWIIAITGVFISASVVFPWEGMSYSIGNTDIMAGKHWWIEGMRRPGGFDRASYEVGEKILVLGVFLFCFTKNIFSKIILWLLTGGGLVITTSRSAMLAYMAVTLFWVLFLIFKNQWLSKMMLIGLFMLVTMLPLTFLFVDNFSFLSSADIGGLGTTNSLIDRATWMWPDAFEMLVEEANVITGRGVGGIGTPQQYFETFTDRNAADNLFVFLLVTFGLFSLLFLLAYLFRLLRLNIYQNTQTVFIFVMGITIFAMGITTNVIESPFMCIFGAITIERLFALKRKKIIYETVQV